MKYITNLICRLKKIKGQFKNHPIDSYVYNLKDWFRDYFDILAAPRPWVRFGEILLLMIMIIVLLSLGYAKWWISQPNTPTYIYQKSSDFKMIIEYVK